MTTWNQLTADDLKSRLSAPEWTVASSFLLSPGQNSVLLIDDLICQVSNTVRGYISACRKNQLGPEGTIPDVLKETAIDLLVVASMRRLGGKIVDLDGNREKARLEAIERLKDVAAGRFLVSLPETQDLTPTPSDSGKFGNSCDLL